MEGTIRSGLEFVFNKKLKELLNEKKIVNVGKAAFDISKVEFVRSDANLGNVFFRNLFSGKPVKVCYSGMVKVAQNEGIYRNLEFADHCVMLYFDNQSGEFIITEFEEIIFNSEF